MFRGCPISCLLDFRTAYHSPGRRLELKFSLGLDLRFGPVRMVCDDQFPGQIPIDGQRIPVLIPERFVRLEIDHRQSSKLRVRNHRLDVDVRFGQM